MGRESMGKPFFSLTSKGTPMLLSMEPETKLRLAPETTDLRASETAIEGGAWERR